MSEVNITREDAMDMIHRTEQFFAHTMSEQQTKEFIKRLQDILFEALR